MKSVDAIMEYIPGDIIDPPTGKTYQHDNRGLEAGKRACHGSPYGR